MAAPISLVFKSPHRVWLLSSAILLLITLGMMGTIYRQAALVNEHLVGFELDTLIQLRKSDLEQLKYRDFIEGGGGEIGKNFIQLKTDSTSFTYRKFEPGSQCAVRNVRGLEITMCRPHSLPLVALLLLLLLFIVASLLSFLTLKKLEARNTQELVDYFRAEGVPIAKNAGLVEIIGDLKDIQRQLDASRFKLLEAEKQSALSEQAAIVSHDIRSPLQALETAVYMLDSQPDKAKELIKSAAGRVNDIAESLLDEFKPARNMETEPTANLCVTLQRLVAVKEIEFMHLPGIKFELEIPNTPIPLTVNDSEFQSIVSNLINNSVESIENGTGTVKISASLVEEEIHIIIADSGKGFSQQVLAKIGERGLTSKSNGHGLGIYNAKKLISSWNGEFLVNSKVGVGTSVRINLPSAN